MNFETCISHPRSYLLFISGGAYRAGDFELGSSQAPMLATLIDDAKIGFTSYGNTEVRIYSSVDLPRSKVKVIFQTSPELFHPPS